jgi:L,D-transpeptidase ErfK/SrfK
MILSAMLVFCRVDAAVFDVPQGTDSIVGEVRVVQSSGDNTLLDIARHFDVGYDEITLANPEIDVWLPKPDQRIIVPTQFILPPKPWAGVIINIPQRRLFYFPPPKKGETAKVVTFPIGIAREDWETPLGQSFVKSKQKDPAWFVPKSIRKEHLDAEGVELPEYFPPGPNNPMGMLAVETGFKSIFVHGTNRPWGVGMRVSHGCLHLYPEDAASFFDSVAVKTPLRVINEPVLVGRRDTELRVAMYRPVIEYGPPPSRMTLAATALMPYLQEMKMSAMPTYDLDWARLQSLADSPAEGHVVPVPVTTGTPALDSILAAIPTEAYNAAPYGYDANDARVPDRHQPGAEIPIQLLPPLQPEQQSAPQPAEPVPQ